MILFDSHVHTENSDDAEHSITYIAEKAVEAGLHGLSVTDHCEVDTFKEQHYYRKVTQSLFHSLVAKGTFRDRLKVMCGVELGQPLTDTESVDKVLALGRFDYVLGSVHRLNTLTYYRQMDFEKDADKIPALLNAYFDELCRMAAWGRLDALAHITYPFRYIQGEQHQPVSAELYRDRIDQLLSLCIEKDVAIEVNTSGLHLAIGECQPNLDIVTRYRKLGGRLITVGSDAHSAFSVGSGIAEGCALLRAAGFRSYYYYENRQPVELPLYD